MQNFIDTFEGSGTFICSGGSNITLTDGRFILDSLIYSKNDLDIAFGFKKRYDNHQSLINLPGCVGYIPVIAVKTHRNKSGKSLFVDFIDKEGQFTMLMKGKRLMDNKWIDIDHDFYVGKAYILKCESDPNWADELRIIDFRELKRDK